MSVGQRLEVSSSCGTLASGKYHIWSLTEVLVPEEAETQDNTHPTEIKKWQKLCFKSVNGSME